MRRERRPFFRVPQGVPQSAQEVVERLRVARGTVLLVSIHDLLRAGKREGIRIVRRAFVNGPVRLAGERLHKPAQRTEVEAILDRTFKRRTLPPPPVAHATGEVFALRVRELRAERAVRLEREPHERASAETVDGGDGGLVEFHQRQLNPRPRHGIVTRACT